MGVEIKSSEFDIITEDGYKADLHVKKTVDGRYVYSIRNVIKNKNMIAGTGNGFIFHSTEEEIKNLIEILQKTIEIKI